jgi:hypothetical protein
VALVGLVTGLAATDDDRAEVAAGRSKAGRAGTPWRYASAMAITVRTYESEAL